MRTSLPNWGLKLILQYRYLGIACTRTGTDWPDRRHGAREVQSGSGRAVQREVLDKDQEIHGHTREP